MGCCCSTTASNWDEPIAERGSIPSKRGDECGVFLYHPHDASHSRSGEERAVNDAKTTLYYIFGPPQNQCPERPFKGKVYKHVVAIRRRLSSSADGFSSSGIRPHTNNLTFSDLEEQQDVTLSPVELFLDRHETYQAIFHKGNRDIPLAKLESIEEGSRPFANIRVPTFGRFDDDIDLQQWIPEGAETDTTKPSYFIRVPSPCVAQGTAIWNIGCTVSEGSKGGPILAKAQGFGKWHQAPRQKMKPDKRNNNLTFVKDWDKWPNQYIKVEIANEGVDHGVVLMMVVWKFVLSNYMTAGSTLD